MKLADKIILTILQHGRKDPNEILLPNIYQYGYEMDCFKVMKTGMVVEYEVKISRSDFFNDFKKYQTAYGKFDDKLLAWPDKRNVLKHDQIRDGHGPNRFFFVVPEGLVQKTEIPSHAGLMYYYDGLRGTGISTIKPAPLLHRNEFQNYRQLATSLSWREDRWRRKFYKV